MKIGVHSDLHSECSLCTISNLAELGREGMALTDQHVLKIMTSKGKHNA